MYHLADAPQYDVHVMKDGRSACAGNPTDQLYLPTLEAETHLEGFLFLDKRAVRTCVNEQLSLADTRFLLVLYDDCGGYRKKTA